MGISITTKTGDKGESGLANGQRLSKASLVFEVIGTLDELNSWLGYIVIKLRQTTNPQDQAVHTQLPQTITQLTTVQDTLFYLGAEVAGSKKTKVEKKHLTTLEKAAKKFETELSDSWHQNFLLPGGSETGAIADIARTVCRRCERVIVLYQESKTDLSPLILKYINRLSDYLYLVRCWINRQEGVTEQKFEVKSSYLTKVKPQFSKSK